MPAVMAHQKEDGHGWQIVPVNFQKRHRQMLQWTHTLMSKRFIKIHHSLHNLIVSLRTAVVIDDWKMTNARHQIMIYLMHLGLLVVAMSFRVIVHLPQVFMSQFTLLYIILLSLYKQQIT